MRIQWSWPFELFQWIFCMISHCIVCGRYTSDKANFTFPTLFRPLSLSPHFGTETCHWSETLSYNLLRCSFHHNKMHICHRRLSSPNLLPCSMFLDFVSHCHGLMRSVTAAFLPRKYGSLAGKTRTIKCNLDFCINSSFAFSTIFHLTTHPSPFNESPKSLIGCNPICYILHNLTLPSFS